MPICCQIKVHARSQLLHNDSFVCFRRQFSVWIGCISPAQLHFDWLTERCISLYLYELSRSTNCAIKIWDTCTVLFRAAVGCFFFSMRLKLIFDWFRWFIGRATTRALLIRVTMNKTTPVTTNSNLLCDKSNGASWATSSCCSSNSMNIILLLKKHCHWWEKGQRSWLVTRESYKQPRLHRKNTFKDLTIQVYLV